MLIGKGSRRPNREKIRNIKEALGTALNLPEETAVTVTEIKIPEEGCGPLENAGGPLQTHARPQQNKNNQTRDTVGAG